MTRASARAAKADTAVPASPAPRSHRRQWTHSNFDGSKELRIHRSPAAPDAAPVAEGDEEADEQEETAAAPAHTQDEEDDEEAEQPAAPSRTRKQPASAARTKKQPRGRKAAAAAVPEESEEEQEQQQQQQSDSDDDADALGQGGMDVDDDEPMSASSASASASGAAAVAASGDSGEDDDAWLQDVASWATTELSRRLKTAPASAAAAASSASAAASSTHARPASAGRSVIESSSQLDSIFTSRGRAPAPTAAAAARAAAAATVPHGFVRKGGVLTLSADAVEEATAGDSSAAPSSKHAPDLLASLGSRSAATPLPSANPLQAAKSAKSASGAAPTAGKDWFNLSRPSALTPEIKTDLKLLSLRAYLDPKKFFKKESSARKKKGAAPSFFAMGTVIAGAQDFYSGRLSHSQRTAHFADELVDPEKNRGSVKKMKHYLKRKVMEVQKANTPAPRTFNKKRKTMEDASKRPGSGKKGKGR